jgi:hypothetical protein
MADDKNSEQVLQDCVDELFALQEQVREDQKKFVLESATLIKASQKQLSEAVDLVNKAKQSACQSEQAAKTAGDRAAMYEARARFWKRFALLTGSGFFIAGAVFAVLTWLAGYRLAERQQALDNIEKSALLNQRHHNYPREE